MMPATMARKKKTDKASQTPPDRHKNTVFSLRPSPELRGVIEAEAAAERRSLAQMAEILLEEALAARGKWPVGGDQ